MRFMQRNETGKTGLGFTAEHAMLNYAVVSSGRIMLLSPSEMKQHFDTSDLCQKVRPHFQNIKLLLAASVLSF